MTDQDRDHLRILSILHYVYGGLMALGGCFGLLYVFLGATFMTAATRQPGQGAPPAEIGVIFVAIGAAVCLFAWAMAGCVLAAGKYLSEHRKHLFCLIIAGLECATGILGIVLGVFTIIVLIRPTVKAGFDAGGYADALPAPPPPPPDGGGYYRPG